MLKFIAALTPSVWRSINFSVGFDVKCSHN